MTSPFGSKAMQAEQWRNHRVLSACLRAGAVGVPLLLAMTAGVVTAWSIPGDAAADTVGRILASGIASVVTFALFEWLGRRALPLAALLRMALVFPDRAPKRFSVALRSTSVRRLQEWARQASGEDDPAALAEKVVTLASALNFHDRRTRGHSERTRAVTELLIEELRLPETEANEVRWGAFLHDVGKLLVPAELLNKPGKPTEAEWKDLRRHPVEGGRIVEPLRPFIGRGVDAVTYHHESYDGSGYPAGLRGDDIPFAARVVAVTDSFEVMTAVRSYKRPMSAAEARAELVREAGRQFDPTIVRAFLNVSLGRLHWVAGVAAWVAELPLIGMVPRAAAQVAFGLSSGGTAVTTATLASVATVSLGATLAAGRVMTQMTAASSAPPTAAAAPAAVAPAALGSASALPSASFGTTVSTPSTTTHASPTAPSFDPTGGSGAAGVSNATPAAAVVPDGGAGKSAAPGQTGAPPGQSGTAPGHSGTAPGHSGTAPGHSGTAPGHSGTAPGHSGTAPGHSGTAPGHSGTAPGAAATTLGHVATAAATTLGHVATAAATTLGHVATALGHSGTAPGHSGTAPGHSAQ